MLNNLPINSELLPLKFNVDSMWTICEDILSRAFLKFLHPGNEKIIHLQILKIKIYIFSGIAPGAGEKRPSASACGTSEGTHTPAVPAYVQAASGVGAIEGTQRPAIQADVQAAASGGVVGQGTQRPADQTDVRWKGAPIPPTEEHPGNEKTDKKKKKKKWMKRITCTGYTMTLFTY